MFCKFCGNKIVPSAFSKCSFCGARIDLFDGGQSFFKDAEVETWKNDGLSNGPDTGMPRTEIKEIEEKRIPSRANKEEQMDPRPSKLSLMWIAGTIAFVLLVFGIVRIIDGDKKSSDNSVNNPDSQFIIKVKESIDKVKTEPAPPRGETEDPPAETEEVLATYTVDNRDVIVEDGVTLFNVAKFLVEEEGYTGPEQKSPEDLPGDWTFNPPNGKQIITVKVDDNKVAYRIDGQDIAYETMKTKKEGEKIFVAAVDFIKTVFGDEYKAEISDDKKTVTIKHK